MRKRKNLLFIVLLIFVFTMGFTLAFFTNRYQLENNFTATAYGMSIEKTLDIPTNWKPGDSIDYSLNVTNGSDIDVVARIIVLPRWRGYVSDENNETVEVFYSNYIEPGYYYDYYTQENVWHEGYNLVELNFAAGDNWIAGGTDTATGGTIYYYKHRLSSNQTSSNLFDSLTFNLAAAELKCESVDNDVYENTNSVTSENHVESGYVCSTGYNEANDFVLNLWIQTVQYSAYKGVWNTSIEID